MIAGLKIPIHHPHQAILLSPSPGVPRAWLATAARREAQQHCAGQGCADGNSKAPCPFCSSQSQHMLQNCQRPCRSLPLSPSSGFPRGRVPETAAVSSCTFSFNLSWALKLQLPGSCSLLALTEGGIVREANS